MGMTPSVDDLIAKAEKMAKSDDDKGAMSLANDLVTQYPNEMKVWSLHAYLNGRSGNYAEAVSDFTRAIEINAKEPELGLDKGILTAVDLRFNRGADNFALGNNQSAIDDFTKGLDLCDRHHSDDYRETLLFWRAEALLKLGKKHEALSDLARVRDDFSFWTYKLRTKADLLVDCNRLPG
jgi:tetratricopeptide (TPR) repeat protein